MKNQEIIERDLRHIWHPCTQMKDHEKNLPLIPIKSGKGLYLEDFEGNRFLDAISSWWVNLFGHSNDYINSKIIEQLQNLEHTIFAGFTHESVVKLSERLIDISADNLNRCFYADNGSSAVEVALKMSFHYHKNLGKIKPLFISLENSYHGETLGTLSVGDVALYKETYSNLLIETIQTSTPKDMSQESAIEASEDLYNLLKEHSDRVSALILEPLVQCAGGMHMYNSLYLKRAREICDEFGVHLILDEIAVGFGRVGTMFAYESADIEPDFVTLSKGLTAGYLALSVVLTTDRVYDVFYCDYEKNRNFLHSHSYTGNPIACSAANATLDIFERDNIIENNRAKIEYFRKKCEIFKDLKYVKEVRQTGMVIAIELEGFSNKRVNLDIYKFAIKHSILLRPLGNVIYFMTPYIITESEIDYLVEVTYKAIQNLN